MMSEEKAQQSKVKELWERENWRKQHDWEFKNSFTETTNTEDTNCNI